MTDAIIAAAAFRVLLARGVDAYQDHVDVPEALDQELENDTEANDVWNSITSGKRRMLAQHVLSAKTGKTRSKRVNEAIDALVNFGADLRAWRKGH